jgi:hypothetical protein
VRARAPWSPEEPAVTTTVQVVPVAPPVPKSAKAFLAFAAAGAAVSVGLGVYGREHTPAGRGIFTLGFPAVINMKAWLTTFAMALVLLQLWSALRMYGRLAWPRTTPRWLPFAHRWSGTAAFVLTLPVAYHCLWSLGFQTVDARRLVHSLLGCAFYGAFTTKMLSLRSTRLPGWSLPAVGGLLFTTMVGLWLTAALWFFTNVTFPGF